MGKKNLRVLRFKKILKSETIGVLVILYFLILFGATWFSHNSSKKLIQEREEDARTQAYLNYYYILNNPLLKETTSGIISKGALFDKYALIAFSNFSKNHMPYYYQRLGNAKIYVELLEINYLNQKFVNFKNITLYNHSFINLSSYYTGSEVFYNLINVYDGKTANTYVGILVSKVYYNLGQ